MTQPSGVNVKGAAAAPQTAWSPRASRAATVARTLEQRIVEERLAAGERLGTKTELREEFGVAIATVNEALRLLETQGLVEARPGPGGGVFVAAASARSRLNDLVLGFNLTDTPFYDSLAIRTTLEPLVCREAARYCQPRDAKALRRIVDEMSDAVDDRTAFLGYSAELHSRLAGICANVLLKGLYLTLLGYIEEGILEVESDELFDGPRDLAIHRELVEAIVAGDDQRLELAIDRHLTIAQRWAEAEIG